MSDTSWLNLKGDLAVKASGLEYDPLKHAPIINPIERRAICLKFAVETKSAIYSLTLQHEGPTSVASTIVSVAKVYEDYITGDNNEA